MGAPKGNCNACKYGISGKPIPRSAGMRILKGSDKINKYYKTHKF